MKTRSLRNGPRSIPATKSEQSLFKAVFMYLTPLRFASEIAQLDDGNRLQTIGVNGYVRFDDPATGREREDTVLSFLTAPERLRNIELHRVDPQACFRSFKGISAAQILDLVPVTPILEFDKNDKRFVEAKEVLRDANAANLATMDWQDFEHLIREIFAKEFGTDVRITQASRDRGVDAVAFDPDPIRGGRFIIQAKRYTNTVDVSAVRDL
jgi:restriction system protein